MTHHGTLRAAKRVLSSRQIAVATLLAEGHAYAVVGERLGMSVKTVSSNRERIRKKLGVKTMAQAVALLRERGLVAR